MTTPTDPPARELRPVDRHEWIAIILRARLGGLINGSGKTGANGRSTRGGVSATAFKAVALTWASHANPDGTNIWPGDATIAVEAEVGLPVAQAVKRKMIDLGLTEKVRARSRRHRRGDEYRLTLPSDLLDVIEVLTPAALQVAAVDAYAKRRGKRGESGGSPTDAPDGPGMGDPVDPPHDDTDTDVGSPVDPPHEPTGDECGGSGGAPNDVYGGSGGAHVGDPVERDTYPETNPLDRSPSQTDDEVRTAVTVSRAREAVDNPEPDSAIEETSQPPTAPRRTAGCTRHGRAFDGGTRPDGQPACPLCRRGAPPSPPPDHIAPVIPIHRTAAS